MRNFFLPILTFLATVCDFTSAVDNCLVSGSYDRCQFDGSGNRLDMSVCDLTDADFTEILTCISIVGEDNILYMDISSNQLTTLPAGIFDSLTSLNTLDISSNQFTTLPAGILDSLTSLYTLDISSNQLTTLPAGIFDSLMSLNTLEISSNQFTTLPAGIFDSLTSLYTLSIYQNQLTTLPAGIFDSLTSLYILGLLGNPNLECVPSASISTIIHIHAGVGDECGCDFGDSSDPCSEEALQCSPGAKGYTCEAPDDIPCGDGVDLCDDPHMKGLRGQKIDWSGVNGGWYCLVKDDEADLHVNVRLTAPLPEEFPERQLVTGLSVISTGHSLVVEVTNPYKTHMNDGCPGGVSTPCLANGGLSVTVNGEKGMDDNPLLHPVRGEILPGGNMEVSAANLPVECWEFGGDAIWARHYADMMAQGRRTESGQSFEDWVLSFDHMAAHGWCAENIAKNGLSGVQSSHAIFQVVTPAIVVRLNVGVGHQIGGELDWDGRVLPDLDVWQMDVGLVGLSVENESLTGILGETARPVYDKDDHAVMSGDDAFRGTVEDYRVSDGLGMDFALLHHIN